MTSVPRLHRGLRVMSRVASILLVLAMAGRATAQAQTGGVQGVIRLLNSKREPVANVELSLTPGDRVTRSDSAGRFRFVALPLGRYLMAARKIGFAPEFVVVEADSTDAAPVELFLDARAQRLATVTINGQRVTYPVRLMDAYTRAARGTGSFFTAEQIDSLFPLDVHSLLTRIPGVHVNGPTIEFVRCREMSSATQRVQVYVDGQQRTRYGLNGENTVRATEALRDIVPSSIQLIEVYSGVARVPGEYLSDACAVILVWLK